MTYNLFIFAAHTIQQRLGWDVYLYHNNTAFWLLSIAIQVRSNHIMSPHRTCFISFNFNHIWIFHSIVDETRRKLIKMGLISGGFIIKYAGFKGFFKSIGKSGHLKNLAYSRCLHKLHLEGQIWRNSFRIRKPLECNRFTIIYSRIQVCMRTFSVVRPG